MSNETHRFAAAHGPTGWFEPLYAEAGAGTAAVPWDRPAPSRLLTDWARPGDGRCVVVGCGYGRDAEHMAALGWRVTGFDVSATAIAEAGRRHPGSPVTYAVADLFALPAGWSGGFDLVIESMNVQALPHDLRPAATAAVASLVARGGTLLALEASGDGSEDGPPWPFTEDDMGAYATGGLVQHELVPVAREDGAAWWRGVFTRA